MKNILFPISIIFNVILIISCIVTCSNETQIIDENANLFEYMDAHKAYNKAVAEYESNTKNWTNEDKYKSSFYYNLKKSQERFKTIQFEVFNEYY